MRLIAAVDKNWGLGYKNELQFRISSDLKRFRLYTTDGIVVCGRKTLQTFPGGKPLKNRINLILSSCMKETENAIICKSRDEVFAWLREFIKQGYKSDQINIIGGASVYDQFMPFCDQALITFVYAEKTADCYFPDLDRLDNWILTEKTDIFEDGKTQYEYRTYINLKPEVF